MNYLTTRTDMLRLIAPNARILEIGVFAGHFSDEILRICNPRQLFLVDIWQGTFGSGDKDGRDHTVIQNMQDEYFKLVKHFKDYAGVRLVRAPSADFLRACDAHFFDAIYVDGDHSYDAVLQDLRESLPRIKPGGWLMGHDYHGQVKPAVDDFCREANLSISYIAQDGCPSFAIQIPK